MPTQSSQSFNVGKNSHSLADQRLAESANTAKNQLISEINQFNYITEQGGTNKAKSFEDEETNEHMFFVSNPIKMDDKSGMISMGSVIKYTVTGIDSEGKFEVQRRYKEFDALHLALLDRWPGCYVPAIPEKQVTGDKEDAFVEQRRSLLERFMRECGKYEYLIESKEFKIFTRSTAGEIDTVLKALPKQTPMQILEKYRLNFKITEDGDNSELTRYREKVNIFNAFVTKATISMNRDVNNIAAARSAFQQSYGHYNQMYKSFMKFEDVAIDYFADGDISQRTLTHPGATEIAEKITETISSYKNPFQECDIWIKGELLDIQGMIDAMRGREIVVKKCTEAEGKKRDD